MLSKESDKLSLFKYLEGVFNDLEQQKIALDKSAIVAFTDTKGDITYVNDKFCEISQYAREELMGQNHRIINSGYHDKGFFTHLWRTIAQGKVWSGEIRNRAKDGSYYWVYTTIVPYLGANGKPYQYVSIRFDITKQKNQELELKQRTKQLEDFCFIVSHNLRAPLSNLLLLTSMIKESDSFEDQRALIDKLAKPVHILNETFNELVESLQIRQDVNIKKEKLRFDECFQKTMESLNVDVIYPDITIDANFEKAPEISYPKKYLMSIMHNLLSNAIRYRSPKRKLKVELESYLKNGEVHMKVRDNGIGIDMAANEKKLFGLRKTFHDNHDAKGFGLFITKTQVETMGGAIYAESELEKGSTFFVQFHKNESYERN